MRERCPSRREIGRDDICVLIPAYNEGRQIGEVIRGALEHAGAVLVVDDGSADDTARAARAAGADVLQHAKNRGKGAALQTGFHAARERSFQLIVTLDADGQHRPEEIPKFIEAYARTGIPVLIGNRMANLEGMPWIRRWTNQVMSLMLCRRMRAYAADTQCGFRLFRSDVIPYAFAESDRFAAESEILLHIAKRRIRMGSVRIQTIYGSERSSIRPVMDTIRFFRMLCRMRRQERRSQQCRTDTE
jgi:glycosyltransferase involved in cell wall biosynthesis